MRSSLKSFSRMVKDTVKQTAEPRVREAFVLDQFTSGARELLIQVGDPTLGRGTVVKATIQAGVQITSLQQFDAVSVICKHGHYSIIGLRSSS